MKNNIYPNPLFYPKKPNTKTASLDETLKSSMNIKVKFDFDMDLVAKVKTLYGRVYINNEKEKYWKVALTIDNIDKLVDWGFTLDERLKEIYDIQSQRKLKNFNLHEIDIKGLKGNLFPYQNKGVSFIEENRGKALIADEMGLGKTVQALAWLQLHPEVRPAIIVCPSSLKYNWKKEAYQWLPNPKVQILSGIEPNDDIIGELIIVNYDILVYWEKAIKAINPKAIIIDECHYIKNRKAQRTKALLKIAKGVDNIIGLSGTPIINKPIEFFTILHLISPNLFPSEWAYAMEYCGAKHNGFGWDFNGATNTQKLHKILSETIMIRRKKNEVLKQLPDKIRSIVTLEISNRNKYEYAAKDFLQFLEKTAGKDRAEKASNAEILQEIEILKQVAVKGKLNEACEWIDNFLTSGEKLVIFANHSFVIDFLMEKYHHISVKIDGSIPSYKRQEIVENFQKNPAIKLFIGNIKASGVGITLTASSNIAFLELPWTPGELDQAEDRCHRIGQKNSVNIYQFIAINTIEEQIAQILDKKRVVLNATLDGLETQQESLLTELINNIK